MRPKEDKSAVHIRDPLPPASLLIGLDKPLDGAIVGPLHIPREKACRQFTRLPMIGKALTANALPAAWFVGTVAACLILLNAALSHMQSPFAMIPGKLPLVCKIGPASPLTIMPR